MFVNIVIMMVVMMVMIMLMIIVIIFMVFCFKVVCGVSCGGYCFRKYWGFVFVSLEIVNVFKILIGGVFRFVSVGV